MILFRRDSGVFCRHCGRRPRQCPTKLKRLSSNVRVAVGLTFKERSADGMSAFFADLRWLGAGVTTIDFQCLPFSRLASTRAESSTNLLEALFFGAGNLCLGVVEYMVKQHHPWQQAL
jgi:hypothetical protein